jgi:anti-sigma regulatory factor (Ser/Thr protein kinase)
MTQASSSHVFPARLAALPHVLARVRGVCAEFGLTPALALRIELAAEELFTNTITHGYGQDCDAPVWLQLIVQPGCLCVIYQDAARAFDPVSHAVRVSGPVEKRPIGGLGIHLVRELATEMSYRRVADRNILTLNFKT